MRERACNSRAHCRMNRGFFQPLTPEERECGWIIPTGAGGDDPRDDNVKTVAGKAMSVSRQWGSRGQEVL